MPRFGQIDFPDEVLDALRDNRLVVFAGAGVSMGAPSDLPGFKKLCVKIHGHLHSKTAERAQCYLDDESFDMYFGAVLDKEPNVRADVAQRLSPEEAKPNDLHRDILRMFGGAERIRLVTTNFDTLFESAACSLHGAGVVESYRSPALPLGHSLRGIVHLHGSVSDPAGMVLSDRDFGRAYLTEGWARRFLVRLFETYTVLFVGYSHRDTVLSYLAGALPPDAVRGRFLLERDDEGDGRERRRLGIEVVPFPPSEDRAGYGALFVSIGHLADLTCRGALEWDRILKSTGEQAPPEDIGTADEIKHALKEDYRAKLLLDRCRHEGWPEWFGQRKFLDPLFSDGQLAPRDGMFASWIAEHYVLQHPQAIFRLIAGRSDQTIHPVFWDRIASAVKSPQAKVSEKGVILQWVAFLLDRAPRHGTPYRLVNLGECALERGDARLALEVFFQSTNPRLVLKQDTLLHGLIGGEGAAPVEPSFEFPHDDHFVSRLWQRIHSQAISDVAIPVLGVLSHRFEKCQALRVGWLEDTSSSWSQFGRRSIEHDGPEGDSRCWHAMIDALRDSLASLARSESTHWRSWTDQFMGSTEPMLRRIALHGMTMNDRVAANEKLRWLVERADLYGFEEHHERFQLLQAAYPAASDECRRTVVEALVGAVEPHCEERGEESAERSLFEVLEWLHRWAPECEHLAGPLSEVRAKHPEWRPQQQPDYLWGVHEVSSGNQSPVSATELASMSASSVMARLLELPDWAFEGPDRGGLVEQIKQACKQGGRWGIGLLRELLSAEELPEAPWHEILFGVSQSVMAQDDWSELLDMIEQSSTLRAEAPRGILHVLIALVGEHDDAVPGQLLSKARTIARMLWDEAVASEEPHEESDWLHLAINRPAGEIARFWIASIDRRRRQEETTESSFRHMAEEERDFLTVAVRDGGLRGDLARTIIASHVAFLFWIEEEWARNEVLPLFCPGAPEQHFVQAWHGFLWWGRLDVGLAPAMRPAFCEMWTSGRIELLQEHQRLRFLEYFAYLTAVLTPDPWDGLIPAMLTHATPEDLRSFAGAVRHFLQDMKQDGVSNVWASWMRRFWENRMIDGSSPAGNEERIALLGWLPYLDRDFPEAVRIATQSLPVTTQNIYLSRPLMERNLAAQFPAATVDLICYLCRGDLGFAKWDIKELADVLRGGDLGETDRKRLEESLIRARID